jgi:hypothetical protein
MLSANRHSPVEHRVKTGEAHHLRRSSRDHRAENPRPAFREIGVDLAPKRKRLTKRTFRDRPFLGSMSVQEVSQCLARKWVRGVRGAALRIGSV